MRAALDSQPATTMVAHDPERQAFSTFFEPADGAHGRPFGDPNRDVYCGRFASGPSDGASSL
eukprot:10676425-Alexandrium_andersonii.AAC.1